RSEGERVVVPLLLTRVLQQSIDRSPELLAKHREADSSRDRIYQLTLTFELHQPAEFIKRHMQVGAHEAYQPEQPPQQGILDLRSVIQGERVAGEWLPQGDLEHAYKLLGWQS